MKMQRISCGKLSEYGYYRSVEVLLALVALSVGLFHVACWAQATPLQPRPASKAAVVDENSQKAVDQLSLKQTIQSVQDAKGHLKIQQLLIEKYRNATVDFKANAENLDALRRNGATEEFIALIKKITEPKPTPPSPSPPVTGRVEVSCSPAECAVSFGTDPAVPTQGGKLIFEKAPLGQVILSFSKPEFDTKTREIQVTAGNLVVPEVKLLPDPIARAKEAKKWLEKVRMALGAAERGTPQQEFSAGGSATLTDANGMQIDWGITVKFSEKTASTIEFQTHAGKPVLKLQCDATCKIVKNPGINFPKKPPIDAEETSILMTQFRRLHLGNMISRLTAPEVGPISTDGQLSGKRLILLDGNDESYEIEVGTGDLISVVSVTPKFGGDPYQVIYSDYVKIPPSALYPRRTEYHMKKGKRAFKIEFTGPVSKPG